MLQDLVIRLDTITDPAVVAFLGEHLAQMRTITSCAESMHALDVDELRAPEVTMWTMWSGDEVVASGALKDLGDGHGELKSMRTAPQHTRRGLASKMLAHILFEAEQRGFQRVSLETGAEDFFAPARKLYAANGFTECEPFGSYVPDSNSVFFTRALT
ncbi:GNAT family N-acetyltransferase [Nocardia camponoti]|uniref:N-acetyltransferase YsnE n=1 Tax=Nocardia camponoti TaxID=1616106 RepID=A0A917V3V8_9NOCA|nr:GNAT family N-acetyltransferase [Nocardia camponoti]GGK35936.1 putative N-acetyltransferase YsnE [Nocardia camponoti]